MNLNFRPATLTDIPVITALAHKIWHQHYPSIITVEQIDFMLGDRYSPEAITKGMQQGEQYFLAFDGEEPVALADIQKRESDYYLHKFYVDVSKHRAGIGTAFFAYLLQQMDNTLPIRLQVNRQNFKAVNFYFRSGFVIESVGDFDIGGGYFMNDFIMLRKPTA